MARAIADCLARRKYKPQVWDEVLLKQNESTFDGLLRISTEVDFAVFVWGANDVTMTRGQSIPSPRDNVVWETGLFLGALGKDRVFVVVDETASVKIPTDYLGITHAEYDGSSIGTNDISVVRPACDVIDSNIGKRQVPDDLFRLQGQWKSRFAAGPFVDHPVFIDDVEIKAGPDAISLIGFSGTIPYRGEARVHDENQIIGRWTHPSERAMAKGVFMLIVSPTADSMYGYSTSQDAYGATIFGTWVFAKKDGVSDQDTLSRLVREQKFLQEHTISPPLPPSPGLSKAEQNRDVYGEWLCAVQPVYYSTPKWHVQKIRAEPSELGLKFQTTKDSPGKLQWEWTPRLEYNTFLVGPWKSLRPTSDSHGYMSVQLSSNGLYMFGHDFGVVSKHENSNLGILLFGRTQKDLESAWNAMSKGFRPILPLSETVDFL